MLAHPSVMIRKSALIEAGNYRSVLRNGHSDLAEDFELWLRLSKIGLIWNSEKPLTIYRLHENQISFKNRLHQDVATFILASSIKSKITLEGYFDLNVKVDQNRIYKFFINSNLRTKILLKILFLRVRNNSNPYIIRIIVDKLLFASYKMLAGL